MLDYKMLPILAFATALAQPGPIQPTIEGHWRNPGRSVVISIAPCGPAWCGHVLWASEKAMADARKAGTDPLIGVVLVSEIIAKGKGRWKARLFVADLNRTSRAELIETGFDQLEVKGCTVARLVCKSQIWTRMPAE